MKKAFLSLLFFVSIASLANAAELQLVSSDAPREGESISVTVFLDTKGESINALEGTFSYPRDILRLKEIRDGNSIVNFWVERPEDTEGIRFAGITPGGYAGEKGEVFSLVFDVLETKNARFALSGAKAYANDGEGTTVALTLGNSTVDATVIRTETQLDSTPPDAFHPFFGSDPSLFDGKTFIVFASQDKESGIDRYEIAEAKGFRRPSFLFWTLSWKEATSPYLILDQSGHSYVYVRAVDQAGNERYDVLSPERASIAYNPYLYLAILLVLLILWGSYVRRRSSISR